MKKRVAILSNRKAKTFKPFGFILKFTGFWPIGFIFLLVLILFFPFFSKGLVPIPADITVGLYFPWLDYKWGYEVGVPVKNPLLSDIPSLLYPWRLEAINQVGNLNIPLWNPYYFAGMPLLANFQTAFFSYINILFLFLPSALAWNWGIVLQPVLAIGFAYLFLRGKKLDQAPALLAGIIFALSGFSIAWLEYNVHGHTAYFLPLILFLIDRYFQEKKNRWLLGVSFAIAFQIFTGYIPIVIYSYLVVGLYVLAFYFDFNRLVELVKLVLFGVIGWGLAAIQILPGLELVKLSIRNVDPIVKASNASFLPPQNLITLIAPDFFGNPATHNYWGQAFYDNFAFWLGSAATVLVLVALFNILKSKFYRFWGLVLLISLILVLENSLGRWLQRVLFLEGGVASRAFFMTDFSLAILAGYGLEILLKEKRKVFGQLLIALVLVGGGLGALGVLGYRINNPAHRIIALRNIVVPTGFFLLSVPLLLATVLSRRSLYLCTFMSLYLFLISANLLYHAKKYLPFSKPELIFPTTPVIEFLQRQEAPFRFEPGEVIPQNMWMPYGLEAASGSDAVLPKRIGEFLNAVNTGKIEKEIARVQLIKDYDSPLFPLLNVKYILAKKKTEMGIFSSEGKPPERFLNKTRYKLVFEDKTVQVYEDRKALPRALWVYDLEVIEDNQEIIKRSNDPKFNFGETIILEEDPNLVFSKKKATITQIDWIDYQPGRLKMIVESDQPGLVFLANNSYPGWEAFVDGVETKIYRANYTFQAVEVPKGEHIIELVYDPLSFRRGAFISLGVLIIILGEVGAFLVVGVAPKAIAKIVRLFD